jgi:hypothetical protein
MYEQAERETKTTDDAVSESRLDAFRRDVNWHLACGELADFDLPVTDDDGGFPVIVALEDERLSVVLGRLRAVGGFANLFVEGDRRVRMVSVIRTECAIGTPDDVFDTDTPSATATVGMFLDYVERNPNGVAISTAVAGHPACARDARTVEFAGSPS